MNNMINTKLLELLSGVDKNKLEQVSKIVQNMSRDDLENLTRMLGVIPSSQEPKQSGT